MLRHAVAALVKCSLTLLHVYCSLLTSVEDVLLVRADA